MLGPSFADDLAGAGLSGLPIVWFEDGSITGRENLTPEQNAALDAVIAAHDPAQMPRRKVAKSVVQQRLIDRGKIGAALQGLQADPAKFARWFAPDHPEVYADDPEAIAFVQALGEDPGVILAP